MIGAMRSDEAKVEDEQHMLCLVEVREGEVVPFMVR